MVETGVWDKITACLTPKRASAQSCHESSGRLRRRFTSKTEETGPPQASARTTALSGSCEESLRDAMGMRKGMRTEREGWKRRVVVCGVSSER